MDIAVIYHSETGNTKKMAELVAEGAQKISGINSTIMSVDNLDKAVLESARAVLFGSPTYYGTMSWQMKKCIDTFPVKLKGKLGAVFASAAWPGGGGYELSEINMIQGLLIRGMMIYSGGVVSGNPPTHFGAVSQKEPENFDRERCMKLGENVAEKAKELF
ncbi:MAG: flavodoxin family protein [Bacillota bacterium]